MTDREARLLSEREGRRRPFARTEPVPPALRPALRGWLGRFWGPHLEERVALRLGLELTPRGRLPRSVSPPTRLAHHPGLDDDWLLLDAVDLTLQWDEALNEQLGLQQLTPPTDDGEPWPQFTRLRELSELDTLFDDSGSTYQVWAPPGAAAPTLTTRVDPTLQASLDHTVASADRPAAGLLARAWSKAYGRETDPDGAYLDALRAVETLACPLVLPASSRATLSSVTHHLRSAPQNWELLMTKLGDGSVDPLVEVFDRLWHGNLASRHGSLGYREVTLVEARAGVQLAAVCVQWLTDGVLRPRGHSSAS